MQMPDYKSMYFQLAAKVADAVELLIEAQLQGEEQYLAEQNPPPIILSEPIAEKKLSVK